MRILQLVLVWFSLQETFAHQSLPEKNLLPSTTSDKVSNVLRDVLNQESLVRFSMVQKIQNLVMDALERRNSSEIMRTRLSNVVKEVHSLEETENRIKEENVKVNKELMNIKSTLGEREQKEMVQTVEIDTLKNETLALQEKYDHLLYENNAFQFQMHQMNETMKEIEGSLATFTKTLNEDLQSIREDQNVSKMALLNISSQTSSACDHDWIQLANICYVLSSENATFSDAMKWCSIVKPGANIAEIRTPEEEKWIDFYLKIQGVRQIWIGLTDVIKENDFVFVSDGQKPNYTNWRNGEPNNSGGSEDCAEKNTGSNWNDIICSKKRSFLCKTG